MIVHAPSEEKSDDSRGSFYNELRQVSDHFPKCCIKIILRDLNAKVGRERERIFSDRQLGITVNVRIVMIMVSE